MTRKLRATAAAAAVTAFTGAVIVATVMVGQASGGLDRSALQQDANEIRAAGVTGVEADARDGGRLVAVRSGVADLTKLPRPRAEGYTPFPSEWSLADTPLLD